MSGRDKHLLSVRMVSHICTTVLEKKLLSCCTKDVKSAWRRNAQDLEETREREDAVSLARLRSGHSQELGGKVQEVD